MSIKLTIPVYFQQTKKKKVLTSWNWWSSAHWGSQNKFKQELSFHIKSQLAEATPIKGKYFVTYTYYYKNSTSDVSNVCGLISKVLNDALQEAGLVEQDNVKFLIKETFLVGDKSLKDPRVEACIESELF